MSFWRNKKSILYFFIILIPMIVATQYFLFKYGLISPLIKGVEFNIAKGNYIQNIDEYIIKKGDTVEVDIGSYVMIPNYAKSPNINYKASDKNILAINGNKITGINEGYSALFITKNDRSIKKATIRVVNPIVQSLNVNLSDTLKYVGDTSDIEVDVSVNFDFNDKEKYIYEISNTDVIKIEDNKVKAIGVGSSDLIIKSGDQKQICKFNNIQAKVSSISTDKSIDIEVNESKKLNIKVTTSPKNLKHPTIRYEYIGRKIPISKVVDISKDGTITGIREGTGKIKVICGNKSTEITVNVKKESIKNKEIENLDVYYNTIDGNMEIISIWDYIENISEYEIYIRNNSLGESEFSLYKSINVDKNSLVDNKIKDIINIDLKDIQHPSIDLYIVGKSEGKYSKKSEIAEIRHTYQNPNNIINTTVKNLAWKIDENNNINISWDKIDNIDCTYNIYIKNNKIQQSEAYVLYQHGIIDNSFTINSLGDIIDVDIYVDASNAQGHSEKSNIVNIKYNKIK